MPAAFDALRRQMWLSRAALIEGDHATALAQLTQADTNVGDLALEVEYHLLRADASAAAGEWFAAAQSRAWDSLIAEYQRRGTNQIDLISALNHLGPQRLRELAVDQPATMRGWIDLVERLRGLRQVESIGPIDLADWRTTNPGHPLLDGILSNAHLRVREEFHPLERVAVLVPESGVYADVGRAVREGVLAAWYLDGPDRPALSIVDTTLAQDHAALYAALAAEQTNLILGPLRKEVLAAIATSAPTSVPVFALNALEADAALPAGWVQFGLPPETEAVALAQRFFADGHRNAVMLAPNNDAGQRTARAFGAELAALGGRLLAVEHYDTEGFDFGQPVRAALAVDASESRRRALQDAIGMRMEFEPRPRGDVDAIVVSAQPRQARLLKPLFEFHYPDAMPVYATSSAYSGVADPPRDADLDGVRFEDLPWIIEPQRFGELSRNRIEALLEHARSQYRRLFALGADGYRLAVAAHRDGDTTLDGLTGQLAINSTGVVMRTPAWAEFRDGLAIPLREDGSIGTSAEALPTTPIVMPAR